MVAPACISTSRRTMAGHSHWAKIKRAKGSNDAQRAVLFAKISSEIIAAARAAGGDLANIRLQAAITKAKSNNMPKSNIDNAVKRGTEAKGGANPEVVTYEGIGPGSVAVIVEALTDNRKRTAPAVRHIFSKAGGSLGTSGSVSWMFERRGLLEVEKKGAEDEGLMEAALEAGAEDVEEEDEARDGKHIARVYCAVGDLGSVQKELESRGYPCLLVQFVHRPMQQYMQDIKSEADVAAFTTMLEAFENDPDCQEIFHNAADPPSAASA